MNPLINDGHAECCIGSLFAEDQYHAQQCIGQANSSSFLESSSGRIGRMHMQALSYGPWRWTSLWHFVRSRSSRLLFTHISYFFVVARTLRKGGCFDAMRTSDLRYPGTKTCSLNQTCIWWDVWEKIVWGNLSCSLSPLTTDSTCLDRRFSVVVAGAAWRGMNIDGSKSGGRTITPSIANQ